MKYYVTADTHGFFDELQEALDKEGFFTDAKPHKLIVCGDLFDRGAQALQLQQFILDLLGKNEVILIRGNHEDLAMSLLNGWSRGEYLEGTHYSNGTIDTVLQLTECTAGDLFYMPEEVGRAFLRSPFVQKIIPAMVDYFETPHFVFTHGWIPCTVMNRAGRARSAGSASSVGDVHDVGDASGVGSTTSYAYDIDWRRAPQRAWEQARWINGMEAAHEGAIEPGKTIVCGHWHCSFGHAHYEGNGGEFDSSPNFSPYYGEGIIALDACTARSRKVNCIVLED